MDGRISSADLITWEVEDFGETVVEIGRVVMKEGRGETINDGKFIVIWKREVDGWKLHRDLVNSNLPA